MRRLVFTGSFASVLGVLASGVVGPLWAQPQQAVVIQGGTLVDGNGGAPVANSVVVILANAGSRSVEVKNPAPLDANAWGDTSNMAHILVPFSFTTARSHNKY